MKVILQQDVKGHGKKGQMIEVSDGFGRNYLLPRKLAIEATADNINSMRVKEKARQAQIEREKQAAIEASKQLENCVVKVAARAGEGGRLFGAVTSKEIADALAAQHGITVEKNRLVLPEAIKSYGTYEIKCKLGYEVNAVFTLVVADK